MKGYKGFSKGLVCRNKQYAENTVFEEEKAVICSSGMHFCENPFDVLDYYPLLDGDCKPNEFAEVEALADVKTDDNKKFCTTKLKIGAKLDFAGFVKACFNFVYERATKDMPDTASGYNSQLAASGKYSQLAASGDNSKLAASGYNSQLAASGYNSQLAASGDNSQLAASGKYSQLAASGKYSVVAGIGIDNVAKASKGSWITLAEWEWSNEKDRYIPVCVKTEFVDGERIKADTFYMLKGGEFKEWR